MMIALVVVVAAGASSGSTTTTRMIATLIVTVGAITAVDVVTRHRSQQTVPVAAMMATHKGNDILQVVEYAVQYMPLRGHVVL
jgi:disulfide bond formation protein DsbB